MIDNPWEDIKKEAKLVSLPDVYLRLTNVLDSPDFAMAEIVTVISQDPSTTLRLLRIVNSSLYGFATKIESVSRAITMLGTQQVHDLVLATSVAKAFKGMASEIMDLQRFWRRSIYCAVASRQLSDLCGGCDKERVFVAGLLHDIGHLVMYRALPSLAQQAIVTARENNKPLYLVERALFGFDYAWTGSELMREWSIPTSLCEITKHHVEPEKAEKVQLETIIVNLASLLTRAGDGEGVFNEGLLTVDPTSWAVTKIYPEDCISLLEQIEEETLEVLNIFFPQK
jgi:HD-like signal output (HDOD) protein